MTISNHKFFLHTIIHLPTTGRVDKLDSSFSRSRSSSMSSLDNISSEAVQCLVFAESFTRKNGESVCNSEPQVTHSAALPLTDPTLLMPTLWIGTSLGSVLTIAITLPDQDSRKTSPVVVTILGMSSFTPSMSEDDDVWNPCLLSGGPSFRLKGSIMCLGFLDSAGALIPNSYEVWRDDKQRDSK